LFVTIRAFADGLKWTHGQQEGLQGRRGFERRALDIVRCGAPLVIYLQDPCGRRDPTIALSRIGRPEPEKQS
jgi:hypothetical protein